MQSNVDNGLARIGLLTFSTEVYIQFMVRNLQCRSVLLVYSEQGVHLVLCYKSANLVHCKWGAHLIHGKKGAHLV